MQIDAQSAQAASGGVDQDGQSYKPAAAPVAPAPAGKGVDQDGQSFKPAATGKPQVASSTLGDPVPDPEPAPAPAPEPVPDPAPEPVAPGTPHKEDDLY